MAAEPPAVIRPLDPSSDRRQLAGFSCRDFRHPWTDVIQDMVRDNLADSVELGQVSGVCIEAGGRICAVAAYTIDAQAKICHSQLLAVQTGSYRRTYGLQLKREIMRLAKEAGARAVVSIVHIDNDPMLELNIKLGASVLRIPGDDDYRQCVIPLFSDT